MRQQGGVKNISGLNDFDALMFFLRNCTIQLVSMGTTGGVLMKLVLSAKILSPYTLNRSNTPNQLVNELLMKICFLHDTYAPLLSDVFEQIHLGKVSDAEFASEFLRQIKAYADSLDRYLEPICPSMIYSDILGNISEFFNIFTHGFDDEGIIGHIIENISSIHPNKTLFKNEFDKNSSSKREFKIGIIITEFLSDYVPLGAFNDNAFRDDPNRNQRTALTIFELDRLYCVGIIHADYHENNFMFNPTYTYAENVKGRVIVIDFGLMHTNYQPAYANNTKNVITVIQSFDKVLSYERIPDIHRHFNYAWLGKYADLVVL